MPKSKTKQSPRPQRIRRLYIRNMARIAEVEFEPPANGLIKIGGKNAAGKSTLLRAVFAGLGGKVPELRDGQEQGEVHLELDDYRVQLTVTAAGDRMRLEAKSRPGESVRAPKTMLKDLFGKRAFDVPEFLFAQPKAQVEALLRIVEIPGSRGEIEALTGGRVDLSAVEPCVTEWLNHAHAEVLAERRVVDRRIEANRSQVQDQDYQDLKPCDLEPLYQLKEKAQRKEVLRSDIAGWERHLAELMRQVQEAQGKLAQLRDELHELEPYQLAAIEQEIAKAREHNQRAAMAEEARTRQAEFQQLNREFMDLSRMLTAIKDYKHEAMARTRFPIPGLDISAGKILYNGHELKQASGAEQMLVAAAIARAEVPAEGLQALFILDPPQLDDESWEMLEQFAYEQMIQVWVAKVTEDAQAAHIYLVEGRNGTGGGGNDNGE